MGCCTTDTYKHMWTAFDSDWRNVAGLKTMESIMVPTIRLDTFMELMQLERIDYLKIDTQGADFMVVKSLGTRILDDARSGRDANTALPGLQRER